MSARILIIEDNIANMELMSYLLQRFGYQVMIASDGESGVAIAGEHTPDLILCDIHLPKLDGFGVVEALKRSAATNAVPIVAVTAQAMVGDRDRLLQAGFDGYLCKPIEAEDFIAQIEAFLPHEIRACRLPHSQADIFH
ncbi:MAG: response regulator [Pseudomonadota bacterium]